jgi:hypothetical protein
LHFVAILRILPSTRWDVYERYGNQVYMTEERWQHALEKRPWLADYLEDVLATIRRGRREQDALNPRKYKYYWPCPALLPEFNHLVVVILFGQNGSNGTTAPNNYVTNVWAVYIYNQR